ncbi:MAG: hypothetical protein JXP36_16370 [Bacteroidales bacterium]|nr:hypothetical protein [Bacteroidales bacterium]
MILYNKIRAVNAILRSASAEVEYFQAKSGIHCIKNCHECCTKQNIYASPLEFYPLAYHLFKTNKAYPFLEELEQAQLNDNSTCILYKPGLFNLEFGCENYMYRGLICRLFGYSFSNDKHGALRINTCRIIKREFADKLNTLPVKTKKPEMQKYYSQFYKIDFIEANRLVPMNEAIQIAIEKILFHYQFRTRRPA